MMRLLAVLAAATTLATTLPAGAAVTFGGYLTVAGNASDLSGLAGPNGSRLSFGSDLFYDRAANQYYGITDRGPGGGLIDYAPRVNVFAANVDSTTAAVSGFQLKRTIVFKGPDGQPLSGLNPGLLPGGNAATLGRSFDPEGFVVRANGNFLVSDEYGPSVYEFRPDGSYVRAFTTPANLVPRQADNTVNYVDGRPVITSGRQDNRGFEGLTLSTDGKTAYAVLQDPLVTEGPQGDGRRGNLVRIVQFDVATGQSTGQFAYQLESVADINARLPAGNTFGATAQGRNIGISAIYTLPNGKLLVIERDNRGIGIDDRNGTANTIGSKRVYLIDLAGASDVSGVSLAGGLNGKTAVSKTLFLDIDAALKAAGVTVAEKFEGLTLGPRVDGGIALLLATDNDFSVTQSGSGVQSDVCTTGQGPGTSTEIAFGGVCPAGQALLPTYLYSFKVTGADALAVGVPEPASWAMLIAGFGLVGGTLRRRATVRARLSI